MKKQKTDIQYLWGEDRLEIDLGNRVASRIKMILCGEFVITVSMATVFLLRSFQVQMWGVGLLLGIGASVLYVLASYRLASRIYYREKIEITPHHFVLTTQTLISKKTYAYDWRCIGTLHYIGKDIQNTCGSDCYDYLNFNKHELLLQDLHHSGNLFFTYKDEPVRFARGIYSWHAEEIVRMIQLYAGNNLKLGAEWKHLIETSEWEE
ncbi:MAG TPA: hypothetical protein VL098_13695 [Flavipsychrobacter sp.]|nr:hypothetical protein [Flavipsychrobacter sp.]